MGRRYRPTIYRARYSITSIGGEIIKSLIDDTKNIEEIMKKEGKLMNTQKKIPEKRRNKIMRYLAGIVLVIIGSIISVITYHNSYDVYELYLIAIILIAGGIGLIVVRNTSMVI